MATATIAPSPVDGNFPPLTEWRAKHNRDHAKALTELEEINALLNQARMRLKILFCQIQFSGCTPGGVSSRKPWMLILAKEVLSKTNPMLNSLYWASEVAAEAQNTLADTMILMDELYGGDKS